MVTFCIFLIIAIIIIIVCYLSLWGKLDSIQEDYYVLKGEYDKVLSELHKYNRARDEKGRFIKKFK